MRSHQVHLLRGCYEQKGLTLEGSAPHYSMGTYSLFCDRSSCQRNRFQIEGFLRGLQGILLQRPLQARDGYSQA